MRTNANGTHLVCGCCGCDGIKLEKPAEPNSDFGGFHQDEPDFTFGTDNAAKIGWSARFMALQKDEIFCPACSPRFKDQCAVYNGCDQPEVTERLNALREKLRSINLLDCWKVTDEFALFCNIEKGCGWNSHVWVMWLPKTPKPLAGRAILRESGAMHVSLSDLLLDDRIQRAFPTREEFAALLSESAKWKWPVRFVGENNKILN